MHIGTLIYDYRFFGVKLKKSPNSMATVSRTMPLYDLLFVSSQK